MADLEGDPVALVLNYVRASQQARASGDPADFEALRAYLADDVLIKQAAAWTESPWRTVHAGADSAVSRLQAPSNAGSRLRTQTVNATGAGGEVLVEQVSTLSTESGKMSSPVCFIFTVAGPKIVAIRFYRNDAGLPAG